MRWLTNLHAYNSTAGGRARAGDIKGLTALAASPRAFDASCNQVLMNGDVPPLFASSGHKGLRAVVVSSAKGNASSLDPLISYVLK